MANPGTEDNPLRVAIIGSGPAGFYAADHLLKQKELTVEVDMYDRLPTPFGLVRDGVAPDHQKIKSVTKAFDRIAKKPGFRFFGYVEYGTDIRLDDLKKHYHQIVFATGAKSDRKLGIPGEDLQGSHPATEFVAWYNGHPDYVEYQFDLSQEQVAVIGVGNVAVDVARILCRTVEELEETDMADYAIEALRSSKVNDVHMLGRRGPAQAAFTNPEVKELGQMPGADAVILAQEAQLDELSAAELDESGDRTTQRKVEIIQELAQREPGGKPRKLVLRFLVSPVELIGDDKGQVVAMKMVKNELYRTEDGSLRPRATDEYEEVPVGLVFRSVGYRGVALPDVPFHEKWGIILNKDGRVIDPDTEKHISGLYATGWIKRGPTGVIGTNKPDSAETVKLMLEDVASGVLLAPPQPDAATAEALIRERKPQFVSYEDWLRLDRMEVAKGEQQGRPRVKFTSSQEMLVALGREAIAAE